jgi:cystathionine beta-lyase/cystathionine gamma-synthase
MIGGTLDPHAAYLILRGLKTYFVRYEAQSASAQRVAELLAAHPAVARVHYPGLPSHPRHALARAQMKDFGTIVSFDLKGGLEASGRFADALQLFAMAASLGSTESLVVTAHIMGGRDLTADQQAVSGVTEGTVRLSIGLEDVDDLLADVTQALSA